jgi:ATP-dependent DNA helicase RecQ
VGATSGRDLACGNGQLAVRGSLRADQERYGALALTAESRPLLREGDIERRAAGAVGAPRELRRRIAAELGVPPYVIFHDATLLAMVEHRPRREGCWG